MKIHDFYAPFSRYESLLQHLLWDERNRGGTYWALRDPPLRIRRPGEPDVLITTAMRRRDVSLITGSTWYRGAWAELEESLPPQLLALHESAWRHAGREISARLTLDSEAAFVLAKAHARELILDAMIKTESGLQEILATPLALDQRHLRQVLASKLGPTPRQLAQIQRWERRALEEGKLTRRQILARVSQKAEYAVSVRARAFASDATVGEVSASRVSAFEAARLLISSGNPLDGRTDPLHGAQARQTRADPRPAGQPWTPAAPFRRLPPYPHGGRMTGRCRCHVESAGTSAHRGFRLIEA